MPSVSVERLEIAYERAGEGPALVLAHGAASDSRSWRPQLEGLAGELDVIAWDEPGSGRSADPPRPATLAGQADLLAGFVEALGVAPCHLGGLSWGGVLALELYRRRPELVATLVLADTYAGWNGSLPASEVEARVAAARRDLAAPPGELELHWPGLFGPDPDPAMVAEHERMMADVRPAALLDLVEAVAACDHRDLLPRIAVPALLVWGEQDARSPLSVARQFHESIPDAELVVIPGAGHMSNMERPDEFNDAVREFCRAHAPPGRGAAGG